MSENMELIVTYEAKTVENQLLKTNFNEIKARVIGEVQKYSLNVTEENIPQAKQVMANFNKVKAEISDRYKVFIDKFSAPINQLKAEKKEIEEIISNGRGKIADAVASFENAKLETIANDIRLYAKNLCDEKNLNFERINISDLIKLSAVTQSGSLTKATKEAIEAKIQALENEILQARLIEQERLAKEAQIAQKAREEAEERAAREKAELEERAAQREAQLLESAKLERQEAIESAKEELKKEAISNAKQTILQSQEPLQEDKAIYVIQATFAIKAPLNAPRYKLEEKIKELLAQAGITNLSKIEVLTC